MEVVPQHMDPLAEVNINNKRRQNLRLQRLNSELLDAVALGDVDEVLRLLTKGASVDATCAPTHCTAVHVAALFGHLAVLGILVDRGAEVDCSDCCDRSPAHLAAWVGSRECLVFLLEKCPELVGARVGVEKMECEVIMGRRQDARCHDHQALLTKLPVLAPGSTALHVASQMAHVECVQCLLDVGADHTATDEGGMTPLDVAGETVVTTRSAEDGDDAQHKKFPLTLQVLISAGAKISKNSLKRNVRKSVIRTAVELRSLEAIRLLVAAFGTLIWDEAGETPLHVAVARRLGEPLKVILEACRIADQWGTGVILEACRTADHSVVDECNAEGVTALHAAVSEQWGTGVNILLEAGASLLARTPTEANVLHLAAATGNTDILAELLKLLDAEGKGPQLLDATNCAGETPLHCAVGSGSLECVALLLNANADVSSKTATVLRRAAERDHPEILDLLLRQAKSPLLDTSHDPGATPLLAAASGGYARCVEVLLRHGCRASPAARGHGVTALHVAAARGHVAVVGLLLRHDAALARESDARGREPLHDACQRGHRECVSVLLASRADLAARCDDDYGDGDKVTAMELLMHNIARPVSFLEKALDASITTNGKSMIDSEVVVTVDYSLLVAGAVDYSLLVAGDQEPNQLRVLDSLRQTGNRFGQQTLLLHPLIESFLYLKWRQMSPYFYVLFALYTMFVVTFSVLCLVSHYFHDTGTPVPPGLDATACRYIVVVVVFVLALIEVGHISQMPLLYLYDAESWIKMTSFALSLVVTFARADDDAPWLRHVTTVAILVTWMQYLYLMSRVPHIGYYILMFARVSVNVVLVLMTFLVLIVGFAISFVIQFEAKPPFNTPWEALIKTFMMMTGDFDYEGLFGDDIAASPVLGRIIFLVFVVMVGIALMNLLVGMAVNNISALELKGNITRLRKQAEFLSLLERMVFDGALAHAPSSRLKDKVYKHGQIPSIVKLYPGNPRKDLTNKLPTLLKEKILQRVMRSSEQIVGEPTLTDIYAQINSLSNSVDVLSGERINVSDHIDTTDGSLEDLTLQLERIKLKLQQVTTNHR